MPTYIAMLGPVIGLNLWTFGMEAWMYALRLPAIGNSGLKFTPESTKEDLKKLPPRVQWPADNYNHLFEQPTQFYAVALTLALLGRDTGVSDLDVKLAWTYVGVRMVHSVVQSVANPIPIRFSLFALSGAVLAGLTARTALTVFDIAF
ncbi:hypothetical protein EJ05DRAFT_478530 [Pseudovirgaria hyperparasitica]|uniref:Membrane-associated proteins in eicosanoid and glutathione metabolism n=1 Tax=Pseudovirgaria hyperparasitica TaxID=470096 RepID=A0A6A6W1U5_9PEZI|nr:uncharacterized protein EJ05DRAFT_478530 [Pseudovirgaria hyperparasitica]KAF2755547.1 hypothetical protein EJ05DRAFT_478530 [Pseudovirgaria hyperparasitica]